MIGIIVTGHGTFASGLKEAVHLLAGEQEAFKIVDFFPKESNDDLEKHLLSSIEELKQDCEEIIICTDIIGGAPFHKANLVSLRDKKIFVLSGINLPSLLEALFSRLSLSAQELLDIVADSPLAKIQIH